MVRFLIWSDLHDTHWSGFEMPDLPAPVDAVLIAGDTHVKGRHLHIPAEAARRYGCPVVAIWGNHEPYGSVRSELRAEEDRQLAALRAEGLDIRVLHGDTTEIAGVRITGATLWTDLKLYPGREALARAVVTGLFNDYRVIRTAPDRPFTGDDMLERHARDKAAVFEALRTPFDGPRVVMTHHLPVRQLLHPARESGHDDRRMLNAGIASDLWDQIRGFDIHTWVCGHSHDTRAWTGDGAHGPIRFVMNPRGYPHERVAFDPAFVITL